MDNRTAPSIREARAGDLPRVREIALRAWEPIYQGYRERMGEELFDRLWPDGWQTGKAQQIADHFEQRPEWCRVAELDGQVVGFITFALDAGTRIAEVGNNAVDPAHQERGIGSAMYRYVLALFREAGMAYAKVRTGLDEAHIAARTTYEHVGFELMIPHGEFYRKL